MAAHPEAVQKLESVSADIGKLVSKLNAPGSLGTSRAKSEVAGNLTAALASLDAAAAAAEELAGGETGEAKADIDELVEGIVEHRRRLAGSVNLLNSSSDFHENRKLIYAEAGHWARHFSTVRMAVITLTLTSCMGFITLRNEWPPSNTLMLPIGVLLLAGTVVFWVFTYYTYKQVRRQYRKRLLLPTSIDDTLTRVKDVQFDWASIVVFLFWCGYTWLAYTTTSGSDGQYCQCILKLCLWLILAAGLTIPFLIRYGLNCRCPKVRDSLRE